MVEKLNLLKKLLVDKKTKYLLLSIFITVVVVGSNTFVTTSRILYIIVFSLILMVFAGILYVQYIDRSHRGLLFTLLLPIHLALGYYLSFFYFPNLGPLIQVLAYISFGLITYVLFLINNIFVVILEKGSLIPLYSAAVAWVQILIIIISIPYISGVYKIPVNAFIQNGILLISVVMFNLYMTWVTYLDPDVKKTSLRERGYLALTLAILTFSFGISVSFFPTESFLRALFVSTVLMFDLSYIYAHYKNRINLRIFLEFGLISFIFLIITIIFNP